MTTPRPTLEQDYAAGRPRSRALHERARQGMPSGVAHDGRVFSPFPFYVERAEGARKWDVDGHAYLDGWSGHGALVLGHGHPAVTEAIVAQARRGLHYSACHELEVRWAELIRGCVPGADRVRFTMTGTETTALAIRVARATTGRAKIVKLEGHFHGVHDAVVPAGKDPFELPMSAGVPDAVLASTLVGRHNDLEHVRALLDAHEVAAVILEPAGARSMVAPTSPAFLRGLRELTRQRGVVLIFDEVVTGFRMAPGGAQEYFGVTPDLTTLAKIVAGGLPGGALAGTRDIMSIIAFRGDPDWDRSQRVAHAGTFNANPLSAAAAIATLEVCADASLQTRASKAGEELRRALAEAMRRVGVPGTCYGEASIYHVSFEGKPGLAGFDRPRQGALYHLLRCALLNEGVDCSANHGWVSAVHTEEDIARTIAAYERAFRAMAAERVFGSA